jgi:hypothetical protein
VSIEPPVVPEFRDDDVERYSRFQVAAAETGATDGTAKVVAVQAVESTPACEGAACSLEVPATN